MSSRSRSSVGSLWILFYKILVPFMRVPFSWLQHLPNAPPTNTITWGIKISRKRPTECSKYRTVPKGRCSNIILDSGLNRPLCLLLIELSNKTIKKTGELKKRHLCQFEWTELLVGSTYISLIYNKGMEWKQPPRQWKDHQCQQYCLSIKMMGGIYSEMWSSPEPLKYTGEYHSLIMENKCQVVI